MKGKTRRLLASAIGMCVTALLCSCADSAEAGKKDILSIDMSDVYVEALQRARLTDYEDPAVVVIGSSKDNGRNQIAIYDNDGQGWKQEYVYAAERTEQEPANLIVLGSEDVTSDGINDLFVAELETGSAWGYEAAVISHDGGKYREVFRYSSSRRNTDAVYHDGANCYLIIASPVIGDGESNADPHRMVITVYKCEFDSGQGAVGTEVVHEVNTEDKYEHMWGWDIEQELKDSGFPVAEDDMVSPIRVLN